ncbi:uncharacterized protein LOC110179601 [Drosophila serrata]|uniref:uncharacterized protein LOC110179601 n=1 Tax=Drosophila serrata TaxID=7274 RepID=UPI000A1D1004|nr:uncharacterized protein LOC110179601 [Drosophila serrata]KAH8388771.1 hypothetical protein KR200_012221 [Drosophila serrata]
MPYQWILIIIMVALIASCGAQPSTTRPKLIIEELEPMRYHFITEHRPTSLGQNYYLKPGQVVGSITLDSDTLQVRHDEENPMTKPVVSKHNILFVAIAKDMAEKTRLRRK